MNFAWSTDQQRLFYRAKEFGERIPPLAPFCPSTWGQVVDFGMLKWPLPRMEGGQELSPLSLAAGFEGFGEGCENNGFALSLHAHLWGGLFPLLHLKPAERRRPLLHRLLTGEVAAHGVTEPGVGGNVLGMETVAQKVEGGYRLKGHKTLVTNGAVASLWVVYARTGEPNSPFGVSPFIVQTPSPLARVTALTALGMEGAALGELQLLDCFVRDTHRIGLEGSGWLLFNKCMEWERTFVTAAMVGAMARIEKLLEPGTRHTEVGMEIGGLRQSTRQLYLKAAWLLEQGKSAGVASAMAKRHGARCWIRSVQLAMEALGGQSYLDHHPLAQQLRDATASLYYSGSGRALAQIIGSGLTSGAPHPRSPSPNAAPRVPANRLPPVPPSP